MTATQLELPMILEDLETQLKRSINRMEEKQDRNRKCLHAKVGEAIKVVYDLRDRFEILERKICQTQLEFKF